jgi:hypothetical protein
VLRGTETPGTDRQQQSTSTDSRGDQFDVTSAARIHRDSFLLTQSSPLRRNDHEPFA